MLMMVLGQFLNPCCVSDVFFSSTQVLRELPTGDMEFTTLAMSRSGLMLFAGTTKGTLLSVKYPLTVTGDWIEYQGHNAAIVKVRTSLYLHLL